MATQDLSRFLFRPEKRYASARMQQGRVILDSDVNEAEMLDDEGQRAVMVDVIGPHGSSTAGFTIVVDQEPTAYDFKILAGSYHLGGVRHRIDDVDGTSQTFLDQSDWAQSSRDDIAAGLPELPELPETERNDFVYMIGWEQTVSAAEDLELVEHALGGRDTSVRVRPMHRVYVRTDADNDCAVAFQALVDELLDIDEEDVAAHVFDAKSNELHSGARLTVTPSVVTPSDDLCGPGDPGYAGHENQAIRVQMIAGDRFLWAFDNASPLFRVRVTHVEDAVTVEFLTPPQEQALFPLKGQVIEILPWGADLPNGEHIADHPIAGNIGGGIYARIDTSYNPGTKVLAATIAAADVTKLVDMLGWFTTEEVVEDVRCFFLRVWNSDEPPLPDAPYGYSTAAPVDLPGTGLSVAITGKGIVGDHWIIAARISTPELVVPWDLLDGTPPHGPRRFYCPLGMIHWSLDGDDITASADSCRRPFRPLTALRGCCNVTVGDGVTSFGDYTSIQTAIDALPVDSACKLCILPGTYEERVVITHRLAPLVIEGCGRRTVLRTPHGNSTSEGLVTIIRCTDLTLRNLKIEATGQFGVTMRGETLERTTWCERVTLEKLDITTYRDPNLPTPSLGQLAVPPGSAPFPLCTVVGLATLGTRLLDCTFTQTGDLSAAANVLFGHSEHLVVRRCDILSPPGEGLSISKAFAGLHIAGDCIDVLVERCDIVGGLGHGITLGGVHLENTVVDPAVPFDPGGTIVMAPTEDCPSVFGNFDVSAAPDARDPPVYLPDAGPHDVQIRRNKIRAMGGSGISVLGFWPEDGIRVVTQILTQDVVIADNLIEQNCNHMPEAQLPVDLIDVAAFGGIVLAIADHLRIRDNIIRYNGTDHRHPICGIYVLHGENIAIENNQIKENGRRVEGTGISGHRAGIALQLIGRQQFGLPSRGNPVDLSQPAARVRGNTVLQPAGRALQIYGLGPMFVEGNYLVSTGQDGLDTRQLDLAAHCIEILNIGQSPELQESDTVPAAIAIFPSPPLLDPNMVVSDQLIDGRILFTDNVIRFNPVPGAGDNIFCVNRFQSYGDVALLNNQFYTRLPPDEGPILFDTVVVAWSNRTSHNRWEDPSGPAAGPHPTTASAATLACMNITTLNQASRCIHVDTTTDPDLPGDPIAVNQIFNSDGCETIPMLSDYLGAPP